MSARAVHEIPVPILTDDELLAEYAHTFTAALATNPDTSPSPEGVDSVLRRNSATMGELLRRGYRSAGPLWQRSESS